MGQICFSKRGDFTSPNSSGFDAEHLVTFGSGRIVTVDLVEVSLFSCFFLRALASNIEICGGFFCQRSGRWVLSIFDHKSQPWDRKWSLTWWRTPLKGS